MSEKILSPQEERIGKSEGKFIFTEKNGSGRADRIFGSFANTKSSVDIQRARYFTESFRRTEGENLTLRWAKALYHIAKKIEIIIDNDQLLAGRVGKIGKYGLIYPELDGCFLKSFAEQAANRTESPFEITDEDVRLISEEIAPYWEGKTFYEELSHSLPKDILKLTYEPSDLFTSRYIVNETSSMRSALQWVHDYKKGIEVGFEAIKADALERLEKLDENADKDKADFLHAIHHLNRCVPLLQGRDSSTGIHAYFQAKDLLGILIGLSKHLDRLTGLVVQIIKPIPPIAWIPLVILWFGIGEGGKVFLIFLGGFFTILINVVDGIRQTDTRLIEVSRSVETPFMKHIFLVVIPGAAPNIFTGLRTGLSSCWMCVVAAELVSSTTGLGYLIMNARQFGQTDKVIIGMLTIGLVGKIMDSLLKLIEKYAVKWS